MTDGQTVLCLFLPTCLSVCLSIRLYVSLSLCLHVSFLSFFLCLSVCLSVSLSLCLHVSYLSFFLCLSLCLCLSVCLSVCLTVSVSERYAVEEKSQWRLDQRFLFDSSVPGGTTPRPHHLPPLGQDGVPEEIEPAREEKTKEKKKKRRRRRHDGEDGSPRHHTPRHDPGV